MSYAANDFILSLLPGEELDILCGSFSIAPNFWDCYACG